MFNGGQGGSGNGLLGPSTAPGTGVIPSTAPGTGATGVPGTLNTGPTLFIPQQMPGGPTVVPWTPPPGQFTPIPLPTSTSQGTAPQPQFTQFPVNNPGTFVNPTIPFTPAPAAMRASSIRVAGESYAATNPIARTTGAFISIIAGIINEMRQLIVP
jgi:hypothetical protein